MARSSASSRIRAEVIRLVAAIPRGRFTTYGSVAAHMNVTPRRVASVLAHLTDEEAGALPWQRVVAADGRISRGMEPELAARQRALLESEGLSFDTKGAILDPGRHFHSPGFRRDIDWSDGP
ncbi:MGMT family protein [Luteolibacter marinus]|uniref:MGMT family protein n=1 Tax=Luteolibacter marinus TaxID=2776705 RepID=UPI00186810B1|nr:MGMT family protein [Luteolibacter marinus]